MPDLEKVMRGLECCSVPGKRCEECPYAECTSALAKDALVLLKEQKKQIDAQLNEQRIWGIYHSHTD